ncbi:hypothetical protein CONLIGDRAFT_707345 [Coniochaeta ligniaria NRRL 30616]|uniref:C2H2-type domain-containing protein n=1 Tax=Coniochaeta ligniaria NRRL 30616 TaxID=1408157 RepID=A0A1J7IHG7_9PEZI|nr:hypothetical protein CONLIGDRAFT_707345 [Coniochaeta ligniaria NRRL 30616]
MSALSESSSISAVFEQCIQSFRTLLLLLQDDECRATRLEQVDLASVLEEFGRLRIWGDQTKANLPCLARGSLDDTLRNDREINELVQGILLRLDSLIDQAIPIAKRQFDPSLGSEQDSVSSVSDDSGSNSDEETAHARRTMPKITFLIRHVLEQIRSLYSLSALLRRPSVTDKFIRSVKGTTEGASRRQLLTLESTFSPFDQEYVAEKLRLWRGLTKSHHQAKFETELVAVMDVESNRRAATADDCEDIWWFCQRLSAANTRRREQLKYWIEHPYKADQVRIAATGDESVVKIPSGKAGGLAGGQAVGQAGTPKSIISSVPSFSTVAVSDVYDTKTNIRPRTVYAPTVGGSRKSTSVPSLPKAAKTAPSFVCPYCGMMLDSKDMANRQSWKRHVFRDLRPYVCTFEDCQAAGKLYVSRHQWISHELQLHRRQFICQECGTVTTGRNTMASHLGQHYSQPLVPSRLSILLDICNRPVDEISVDSCLICAESMPLSALQAHLAGHMEDIAIFVLPLGVDDDDDDRAFADSRRAAKLESSITSTMSTVSGFSSRERSPERDSELEGVGVFHEVDYPYRFKTLKERREWQEHKATIIRFHIEEDKPLHEVQRLMAEQHGFEASIRAYRSRLDRWGVYTREAVEHKEIPPSEPYVTQSEVDTVPQTAPDPGQANPRYLARIKAGAALTHLAENRLDEAAELWFDVIETYRYLLGEEHNHTLTSMHNLGVTLFRLNRFDEAKDMFAPLVVLRMKILGRDNWASLPSMASLARLYQCQGEQLNATQLMSEVLQSHQKIVGPEHPETLRIKESLASIYADQGRHEQARLLMKGAVQGNEEYESDRPDRFDNEKGTRTLTPAQYERRERRRLEQLEEAGHTRIFTAIDDLPIAEDDWDSYWGT